MAFTKRALRTGEICSLVMLYGTAHSNSRNDISMLRSRGWLVESWLMRHTEEQSLHKHYVLVSEAPVRPVQMTLVRA